MSGVILNGHDPRPEPLPESLLERAQREADFTTAQLAWIAINNRGQVLPETMAADQGQAARNLDAWSVRHPTVDPRVTFAIVPLVMVAPRITRAELELNGTAELLERAAAMLGGMSDRVRQLAAELRGEAPADASPT